MCELRTFASRFAFGECDVYFLVFLKADP